MDDIIRRTEPAPKLTTSEGGARIDMTDSAVSAYRARDPMYYPEELEVWSPHMRLRKPRPWLTLLLAALTCAAVLALVFVRAYS